MKRLWVRFWKRLGFYPEPLTFAGIYGTKPSDWKLMTPDKATGDT